MSDFLNPPSEQQLDRVRQRLQDLLAYPREELDIELKGWLDLSSEDDKANLAQALLALANHGGGYVLIGFVEVAGVWGPAQSRPPDLSACTQDDVKPPDLSDLLDILKKVKGHETGWPPWWVPTRNEIRPYVYDGLIECWLGEGDLADPAHSDFWRASPQGMLFLLRGYQEDSAPEEFPPGTRFDLTIPIWRVRILLKI